MNMSSLRRWNISAAVLHLAQGLAVLLLANDFALPVTSFFWNDAPNNSLDTARLERMFDVSIAWAAALFLFKRGVIEVILGCALVGLAIHWLR